ncbi:MAG: extracellular solute-binding protein [Planctomycetes bacterium]|nr:extracellular solute-binding protein [Planctomycetota bacterium]
MNRVREWLLLFGSILLCTGCGSGNPAAPQGSSATSGAGEVVLFTSLDPLFSEPIVADFETQTGIKVKLQTDTEAAKTVGLVNRLIARKAHPECDVYWNNEVGQTLVLQAKDVLEAYVPQNAADIPDAYKDKSGWWTGFAARARVILYNTELVKPEDAPKSLEDLIDPRFKDQVVIAKPLFGTTYSHAAALFAAWGPERAKDWFRKLKANGVKVAPGNAMARNMVADGEAAVCLTDTDDANGAFLKGRPVKMVYPDAAGIGTLVLPNSVALIKGGPNPEHGKKLIEYLVSHAVEAKLAQSESAQMPVRPGVKPYNAQFDPAQVKAMQVDWVKAAEQFPEVKRFVQEELNW